jgi:hypothetical protein
MDQVGRPQRQEESSARGHHVRFSGALRCANRDPTTLDLGTAQTGAIVRRFTHKNRAAPDLQGLGQTRTSRQDDLPLPLFAFRGVTPLVLRTASSVSHRRSHRYSETVNGRISSAACSSSASRRVSSQQRGAQRTPQCRRPLCSWDTSGISHRLTATTRAVWLRRRRGLAYFDLPFVKPRL